MTRPMPPLLPRSGTIDAIHKAQGHLDRLEKQLSAELAHIARELDKCRGALAEITAERDAMKVEALADLKSAEAARDDWKARCLDAERALASYQTTTAPPPAPNQEK